MKNVLILGGKGFLGKGLQKELSKRNINFIARDISDYDLTNGFYEPLMNDLEDVDTVFMLASKVGSALFESDPINQGVQNRIIYFNMTNTLQMASMAYKKQYNVVFMSSSEIFWSMSSPDDIITQNTEPKIDSHNPRSSYAATKLYAESDLNTVFNTFNFYSKVFVFRPFNVYGEGQKRGVVYDMLKSAFCENKIRYSKDTTRSFTSIDSCSKQIVDTVASHCFYVTQNIHDYLSIYIEDLAKVVKSICEKHLNVQNIILEEKEPDKSIQYRQTSHITRNLAEIEAIMKPQILKLSKEVFDDINK